jgi:hypothetical protein
MSGKLRIPALGILALLALLFAAAPAEAAVYYVLNNGSNAWDGLSWGAAFQTIQRGLDVGTHGDTVIVGDGTFSGAGNVNLSFYGKRIHLRSANGAGSTTIDGSNANRAFYLNYSGETNQTIIEGFFITNCRANGDGGAAVFFGTSPSIKYCIFQSNRSTGMAGAIYCYNGASPLIENCNFISNQCGSYGGALEIYTNCNPTFRRCYFYQNVSSSFGGAIEVWANSAPLFESCVFRNNNCTGGVGGAVDPYSNCPVRFVNCLFANNNAGSNGGAIYNLSSATQIINCTFSNNNAATGGAIYNTGTAINPRNSIFWGNTATTWRQISGATLVNLYYCIVQNIANDITGVTQTNCLNGNPAFIGGGDYRLLGASPAIDAGLNSYLDGYLPADADNYPRFMDGNGDFVITVDMGAYEFQTVFTAPSAPSGVTAAGGDRQVTVSWPAVFTATYYKVYYSETSGAPYNPSALAIQGGSPVIVFGNSITLNYLQNWTTYYVAVIACNPYGESGYSNEASAYTGFLPAAPTGVTATGDANQVTISWTASAYAEGYYVYYSETSGAPYNPANIATEGHPAQTTGTTITLTGLPNFYLIYVSIRAYNLVGFSGYSTEASAWIGPKRTFYVSNSGDNTNIGTTRLSPFQTIQYAIDCSHHGDGVIVLDGTYTGPGNTDLHTDGKIINLRSDNGYQDCIIDGQNSARAFNLNGSGETLMTVIDGFLMQNCYNNNVGGAVFLSSSSPLFRNCLLKNNAAQNYGGGIYSSGSSPRIVSCVFISNQAIGGWGGGLDARNYSNPFLSNCRFESNYAGVAGGGASLYSYTAARFEYCAFDSNYSAYGGGILSYTYDCSVFINCRIWNNSGTYGGGICCYNPQGNASFINCTIAYNYTSFIGGGLYCNNSNPVFRNTIICTNRGGTNGFQIYNSGTSALLFYCLYTNETEDINGPPVFTNCLIQSGDPFVDSAGGDLKLFANARAIDAGLNSYFPSGFTEDLGGEPRFFDATEIGTPTIDMGAYEYQEHILAPPVLTAFAENGRIYLVWSRVFKAVSYRIYYSTTSGWPYVSTIVANEGASPVGTTRTEFTLSGLPNGVTFYVVVQAVGKDGESPLSNEIVVIPVSGPNKLPWKNNTITTRHFNCSYSEAGADGGAASFFAVFALLVLGFVAMRKRSF